MYKFCPRCGSQLELKQIEDRKRFVFFSSHRKIIQEALKEEKS